MIPDSPQYRRRQPLKLIVEVRQPLCSTPPPAWPPQAITEVIGPTKMRHATANDDRLSRSDRSYREKLDPTTKNDSLSRIDRPYLGHCLPPFSVVPNVSSWDCAAERFLVSLGESSHDKVITYEDKDSSILWISQLCPFMLR